MKKFIMIVITMAFTPLTFANTEIITPINDGTNKYIVGFSDSSFDYDRKEGMCVIGDPIFTCAEVLKGADIITNNYLSGAHDDIQINLCYNSGDLKGEIFTKVSYTLIGDYGSNIKVERSIKKCSDEVASDYLLQKALISADKPIINGSNERKLVSDTGREISTETSTKLNKSNNPRKAVNN
jgi:hypothetical protein